MATSKRLAVFQNVVDVLNFRQDIKENLKKQRHINIGLLASTNEADITGLKVENGGKFNL